MFVKSINYNLAECLGGQIGGVPPLANRVEKLVCLEKIAARILNLYIGNVSGRQVFRPLFGVYQILFFTYLLFQCQILLNNVVMQFFQTNNIEKKKIKHILLLYLLINYFFILYNVQKKPTHLHTTTQTQNTTTSIMSYYSERCRYINHPKEKTNPNNTHYYKFVNLRVEALDRPLIPNSAFHIKLQFSYIKRIFVFKIEFILTLFGCISNFFR